MSVGVAICSVCKKELYLGESWTYTRIYYDESYNEHAVHYWCIPDFIKQLSAVDMLKYDNELNRIIQYHKKYLNYIDDIEQSK